MCVFSAVRNAGYFDTTDAYTRFETMRALVDHQSVFYNTWWQRGPQTTGNSVGPCIAALPFYSAAELIFHLGYQPCPLHQFLVRAVLFSTVFYSALWMLAICELAFLFGASRKDGVLISLLCGLTTLILPYTKTFQAENLVGLCITAIVIWSTRYRRTGRIAYLAVAALTIGFVVTIKSELLAAAPVLGISCVFGEGLRNRSLASRVQRASAVIIIGLLPGIAINAWFNSMRFGSALDSGYQGFVHFKHRLWPGLLLQFVSAGKGLLLYCPVLIFTLPWFILFWRRWKSDLLLPYLWWTVMSLVYSKWWSPAGDVSLGPRFQVSYIPFGILPLLEFFRFQSRARVALTFVAGCMVTLSAAMQLLFISTSFNVYYHHRILAVPESERYTMVDQLHWNPADSLILGDLGILREGRFDLDFVRCEPSEGGLIIWPALWYLLAAAALAAALLRRTIQPPQPAEQDTKTTRPLEFAPALTLFALGVLQLGYVHGKGLRLIYDSPDYARTSTWAYRINLEKLDAARHETLFGQLSHVTWEGQFLAQVAGEYEFQYTLPGKPTLHLDDHAIKLVPGQQAVMRVKMKEGWHPIRIVCVDVDVQQKAKVKVRMRGAEKFQQLDRNILRH